MQGDKSITMVFRAEEIAAIEAMAKELDLPKVGVVRQGIRLYQMDHEYRKQGFRMTWVDENGHPMVQPVGCPAPE